MGSVTKIWEKVNMVAEGGSHYCSKKTDDICGDACDEVLFLLFADFFYELQLMCDDFFVYS